MIDDLLYEERDGVGWVTFNRPAVKNALTFSMYEELARHCGEAGNSSDVHALVLTGSGGSFAAGTDIAQFRSLRTEKDALDYEATMDRILESVEGCRVPLIAAIDGPCTGGGALVAAACDLRIASPSARVGVPIARTLGNCLSVRNCARLVSLVGYSRAQELLLTGRLLGAEEARQAGFVHEVTGEGGAFEQRVEELAASLKMMAPLTLRASRIALRRVRDAAAPLPSDDLISLCYTSEDFQEGVAAFLERRRANFKGR